MLAISNLLFPKSRYYGKVKPENLAFNANLQEFAQRVSYISGFATNGKMTLEEAFSDIEALMQKLSDSKRQLGIGDRPTQD